MSELFSVHSNIGYLLWSLALASGFVAAVFAFVYMLIWIGSLFPVRDGSWLNTEARLQRRLDRRLARGSDRYFEELRSIEAAIETHRRLLEPREDRFPVIGRIFGLTGLLWLGLVLANWFDYLLPGKVAPKWSEDLVWLWPLFVGIGYILNSFDSSAKNPLILRGVGVPMILVSLFAAWQFISRHLTVSGFAMAAWRAGQ